MYKNLFRFIRDQFQTEAFIPLHAPLIGALEKEIVNDCLASTFVSSVGQHITEFENDLKTLTAATDVVAVSNGTAALQLALIAVNVKNGDEVITQALTFIGTANAISHTGASPIFLDIEKDNLGLDPVKLENFLSQETFLNDKQECINKKTGKKIAACVPVHLFGHPVKINEINAICQKYFIPVIEDAAEALGSYYQNQHLGTFGEIGILSFNGNKIITTGGGGALLFKDKNLALKIRHLSTTAKKPHPYEFFHDQIGYNFRLPAINAALGVAQLKRITHFLKSKRDLALSYQHFFSSREEKFFWEPAQSKSNFWLNAILLKDFEARENFLKQSLTENIMCRPVWKLIPFLPIYAHCQKGDLSNAIHIERCLVNLPSSAREF